MTFSKLLFLALLTVGLTSCSSVPESWGYDLENQSSDNREFCSDIENRNHKFCSGNHIPDAPSS